MAAADIGRIAGGVAFEQLHIAQQAGTGVATLQQVVAQHAVVREAVLQRGLERVDVIDAFADEGPFLESVLIDVRHGVGVGVDAGVAAIDPRIGGGGQVSQVDRHARLQDAVAPRHATPDGNELALVERMRHGAHQLPGAYPRQHGIGV
ncbi:hypothetical protein G6F22_019008 [Rhizopus arrhizus]|nr:hypothetical protein G6F22_019008 [Rhizopus arrhizus]